MAVVAYGVENTNAFQTTPTINSEARDSGGRVRGIIDSYEAAALGVGDINMGGAKVPKGARVIEAWLDNDALGASTTLALKLVGDATLTLIGSTPVNSSSAAVTGPDQTGRYGPVLSDSVVTVTLAGAAATGTIQVGVLYMID